MIPVILIPLPEKCVDSIDSKLPDTKDPECHLLSARPMPPSLSALGTIFFVAIFFLI